mmetsp:Transcript_3739/g.10606  ORF Transcript_3739/g.10606 Transcript_3739/m.10606 type:complete len:129 (+) Transcript_3739:117-503(+)
MHGRRCSSSFELSSSRLKSSIIIMLSLIQQTCLLNISPFLRLVCNRLYIFIFFGHLIDADVHHCCTSKHWQWISSLLKKRIERSMKISATTMCSVAPSTHSHNYFRKNKKTSRKNDQTLTMSVAAYPM